MKVHKTESCGRFNCLALYQGGWCDRILLRLFLVNYQLT
ncbi:hypothetical protein B6N60_04062 [Richelia sinica FACHB-800]|uniref:Uncharacterized protein n=1 Tax=Richelia sinica FACHB-800 TaxID=1357546 RepID=A0A975Y6J4_9NOST|nr:hypothetical protein B6N60_04062 [Richelia sinica FACHB-800]